jgi:DNA-binding transcriptional regulator WhiA
MKYNLQNRIGIETFQKLDTPEKSYFLGFLWADGSLTKDTIQLEILSSDALKILPSISKIGDFLTSSRCRSVSNKPTTKIAIYNRDLSKYLRETLDYQTKSISAPTKVLSIIPEKLHRYFWRGYFDGDGSFSKTRTKKNPNWFSYRVEIVSTFEQDWSEFRKLLNSLNIIARFSQRLRSNGHRHSAVAINRKDSVLKFGQYLFDELYDGIGLPRKFEVYQSFLSFLKSPLFQHRNSAIPTIA